MWELYSAFGGHSYGFIFFLVLGVIAVLILKVRWFSELLGSRFARSCLLGAVLLVMMIYGSWLIGYLVLSTYLDHVEPTVAVISILLHRGEEVYPRLESGSGLYGMIYGPATYFFHAAMLLLGGNSILATKLPGASAVLISLVIIGAEVRRSRLEPFGVCLAVGCVVLVFLRFQQFTFWLRPEPFLFLLSSISILTMRSSGYWAAIGVGVILGLLVSLKVHSALYIAPVVVGLLLKSESWAQAVRTVGVMGGVSLTVALLPFALPNVGLVGYLEYISVATKQGFSSAELLHNVMFSAVLVSPAMLIYFLRKPYWPRETIGFSVVLAIGVVIAVLLGAKHGAGNHHILPFIPAVIYVTLQAATIEGRNHLLEVPGPVVVAGIFIAYFCGFVLFGYYNSHRLYGEYAHADVRRLQLEELKKISELYPRAEMGVTDGRAYPQTFQRVELVLRGGEVSLEVPFLMDMRSVGLGHQEAEQLIEGCQIDEWVLPLAGEPFTIANYFSRPQDLFSGKFRSVFHKEYRQVFSGQYYSVWSCQVD